MVLFVSMSAYFLAQTIWFQAGLGWSVLKAGLVGVPFAVTTAVFAGFGVTVLAPRIGRRVLQLGAVVLAAGALVTAATVHVADPSTTWWVFVPGLVVTGAGFGLMVAPIGMFTIAEVPVEKAGAGVRAVQHHDPAGQRGRHRRCSARCSSGSPSGGSRRPRQTCSARPSRWCWSRSPR